MAAEQSKCPGCAEATEEELLNSIYSPVVGRSSFVDGRVSLGTQACDEDTIPPFPQPA